MKNDLSNVGMLIIKKESDVQEIENDNLDQVTTSLLVPHCSQANVAVATENLLEPEIINPNNAMSHDS